MPISARRELQTCRPVGTTITSSWSLASRCSPYRSITCSRRSRSRRRSSCRNPLLSDYPHGKAIQAYGVGYHEGQAGRLYARQTFVLIDKEGIVRGFWTQRPVNPDEVWAPDPVFSSKPILDLARKLVKSP